MPPRPKKVKVKDKPELVRDTFTKAIINTDRSNYAHARLRKKRLLEKQAQVDALSTELASLRALVEKLVGNS